jgi:hypothetical protein
MKEDQKKKKILDGDGIHAEKWLFYATRVF